ncbi:Tyrosinase [Neofusicoccum parvum]|uniref:Putative tyrosinase central domain protein n=1 Tax=Botryosphaeria parva (strain UCR-NP2) TaxID=1287680 RepID=R1GNX8_BOTPV|nr:putative tyrosinase central domain protein [Neofusicoccum parvum UCRNP2]GME60240.1 Tyrosinase [Neofusicoccum parvum]
MQLTQLLNVALLLAGATVEAGPLLKAATEQPSTKLLNLANATLEQISDSALAVAKSRIGSNSTNGCTKDNVTVRKYWGDLTSEERIAYTDAVLCLQKSEPKTPSALAPGAKTRYDDWVAAHINQTNYIHFNAQFLGWHRWFTWEYEQALRNECNYTGAQPYWDWTKTAKTGLAKSPLFDGSATSLSGDGVLLNYSSTDQIIVNGDTDYPTYLTPGTGGGCVMSGPFVNMSVNLGPDGLSILNGKSDNSSYKFEYNPRCLKRSLTDDSNQRFANESSVLTLLTEPQDIYTFEFVMQGYPNTDQLGVHGGGHFSLGGDPGRDLYVSPGDPAFFTHHANIDRVWWMWQMQDPETRTAGASAVSGPYTMNDLFEPHRNGTIEDVLNVGYVAPDTTFKLGELLDTTTGPFCYMYE